MTKDPSFSLTDFKKWISNHSSQCPIFIAEDNKLKPGDQVLVYLSEQKILKKISPFNPQKSLEEMNRICNNLKKNGGLLKEINGSNALIQALGSQEALIVPRLFLRRPKK